MKLNINFLFLEKKFSLFNQKSYLLILLYSYLILLQFDYSVQDLPIHCLKSQIVGRWRIYATDLYSVKNGHEMKCGHVEPSTESTSWKAKSNLPFVNEYEIELGENDVVDLSYIQYSQKSSSSNSTLDANPNSTQIWLGKGEWTMIYDEGFNMEFEDLSFFAFNKYTVERNKTESKEIITYKSKCYSTCVGWYHNRNGTQWGCYRAEKLGVEDVNQTVYVRTKNKTEPEVTYVDPATRKDINYNRYNENKLSDRVSSKMRFLSPPSQFKINEENHLQTSQRLGQHESHGQNSKNNEYIEYYEKLKLVKKSWKEELYPQFMNMTLKELNDFVGFSRNKEELFRVNENFNDLNNKLRFKQEKTSNQEKNFTFHNSTNVDVEEKFMKFPKNFDWKDKLKPTESQGGCGSCYAYAAMRMLEARIKILFDDDVKLSVQHALDCSYYNQGCKGGYSFLVFKFSQDFELVPEDCHPYNAKIGKCSDSCDVNKLDFPYTVENFSYLGGGYGRTDENMMMEELYKNGPFVVSIEPDADFVYYKSGIYSGIKNETWVTQGISPPDWRKVDHSVLLVGWGEDEETKEKYWLIQNSWGINWGEEGFFKIKRGTDELHVESMGEIATPALKDKYKQEYILNPLNVKHMK